VLQDARCSLFVHLTGACPNATFPLHLQGDWYSIDQGEELQTVIEPKKFSNELIESAACQDIYMIPDTKDAQGNYDSKVLLFNQ